MTNTDWRFTVAPMLDWTDRHCRVFHRTLSRRARLYTEMVTTGAILHGDQEKLLGFNACEHPVALQLGGSDPGALRKSVAAAEAFGYDEYNLNCGCPSERVQKGAFGASLMLDAPLVAECLAAMRDATEKPVTVKHRVGVDGRDDYGFVRDFVGTLYEAGTRVFIVHTRSAWLQGLSPKENREIPPLRPEYAPMLKRDFPEATVVVNGAIASIEESQKRIDEGVDGVMLGRAAYHDPWLLTKVDEALYGEEASTITRLEVVERMTEYLEGAWKGDLMVVRATARHMMGLPQGLPGARLWRRFLSDPKSFTTHGPEVLRAAWRATFGE